MSDDGRDRLVEILFRAFPSIDGEELGAVLEEVRQLVEEEIARVCWIKKRRIDGGCESRN